MRFALTVVLAASLFNTSIPSLASAAIIVGQTTGQETGQETSGGMTPRTVAIKRVRERLETMFTSWPREQWLRFAEKCQNQPIQVAVSFPNPDHGDAQSILFSCQQWGVRYWSPRVTTDSLGGFFELSQWPESPIGAVLLDEASLTGSPEDRVVVDWDFAIGALRGWMRQTFTQGA